MTATVNPETGELYNEGQPRFTTWVALVIFSSVALGSSVEVKNLTDNPSSDIKWIVACSSITFACAILILLGHFLSAFSLMGTRIEGLLTVVLTGFWAASVAIVSETTGNVGLGLLDGSVLNGNLYYSSWAGFITAIVLLVNYLKEAFGVDVVGSVQNRAARLSVWASMLAASFIVLGSSVRILKKACDGNDSSYCERTRFAVGSGAVTCLICLVVIGLKVFSSVATLLIELVSGGLLTLLNAFAVAFITSPKGPGSSIGNLYYSSWITFLAAAILTAEAMTERSNAQAYNASAGSKPHDETTDVEMEQI